MRLFQQIAMVAIVGTSTIPLVASYAEAGQGGGRYWTPMITSTVADYERVSKEAPVKREETAHKGERSPLNANGRIPANAKAHNLILQVNTNDPAAMNLALDDATKAKIEVVAFGPGLHMLRDDTSPVEARTEEIALSTPEVSFKACGNTQEKMHSAEQKCSISIDRVAKRKVIADGSRGSPRQ